MATKRQPAAKAGAAKASTARRQGGRLAPVLWYLAAALAIWASGFTSMINSDLWFHLAAGREIWQERAIPRVDGWSFTAAGRPWHNHEWLSGLLFHLWSRLFGVESLVYWQWGVLIAAFLLLFRVLERLAGSRVGARPAGAGRTALPALIGYGAQGFGRLVAWLLLVFALAVAAPFFDIRPHLWSLLGFAVVVHQTVVRPAPSRALPLLFLVWINLHGGAVFGLMALAIGLAARPAIRGTDGAGAAAKGFDRRHWLRRGGLWLACLAATLVNPFGWEAWTYPLRLAFAPQSASRSTLVEWLPPFVPGGIQSPVYPAVIVLGAAAAVTLVASGGFRTRRREALATLGLAALTLAMSLQSRRFIPLFAMAGGLLAATALGALRARQAAATRGISRARRAFDLAAAALAVAVGLLRLAPLPLGPRAFSVSTRLDTLPVAALDHVEAHALAGNLFTQLLWGGYVRYRTPDLRVGMDPRSETVYPGDVQRRYFQVYRHRPGWRAIVDGSRADYFLWPVNSPVRRAMVEELLASGGWDEVYGDSVAVLLARRGSRRPLGAKAFAPGSDQARKPSRRALITEPPRRRGRRARRRR